MIFDIHDCDVTADIMGRPGGPRGEDAEVTVLHRLTQISATHSRSSSNLGDEDHDDARLAAIADVQTQVEALP